MHILRRTYQGGDMEENAEHAERMSYVCEILDLQKMLRKIPPENLIEIATFRGRLDKVCKEYNEAFPIPPATEEMLRSLKNPMHMMLIAVECLGEGEILKCCEACWNATMCCTCMGDHEVD